MGVGRRGEDRGREERGGRGAGRRGEDRGQGGEGRTGGREEGGQGEGMFASSSDLR